MNDSFDSGVSRMPAIEKVCFRKASRNKNQMSWVWKGKSEEADKQQEKDATYKT